MRTMRLTFNLPEDETDARNAADANKAFQLIQVLKDLIRTRLKYQQPTEEEAKYLESMRTTIYEAFPDIDER